MPTPTIDTGNTAWTLAAAALVMLMTPALGFFYGGLVNRKNVLSTLMHSFFILALISIVWVLWGYTLAFGPDKGGIIGGLDNIGLKDISPTTIYAGTNIPQYAFVAFQMMFAVITPALISGAFAERKSFKAFVLFSLLWSTIVYSLLAHWVWGGGWLYKVGAIDFAGGTVIHITSGVAALVTAIVLGKRKSFGTADADPHNLTLTVLGAGLLW
ncbi:MAG TPA: ammonia channel protein, partial [Thermomicrobiales bacterium]|nr:ammonia channel protein [Thermomicrobiales bacterium]